MKKSNTSTKKMSEKEIDRIVENQAEDNSAWEETLKVNKKEPATSSLSADIAARA